MNSDNGARRCGATTRAGTPCQKWAMPNGRCMFHGGKALGGIASPSYKHGRYSKYMPSQSALAERYREALADPDLLELSDDIAVTTAHITELVAQVDISGAARAWRRVTELAEAAREARRAENQAALTRIFARLLNVIDDENERGGGWQSWEELRTAQEHKRRLIESERRRRVDMEQLIPVDQALMYADVFLNSVRTTIIDFFGNDPEQARAILAAIQARFGQAVGKSYMGRIQPGEPTG